MRSNILFAVLSFLIVYGYGQETNSPVLLKKEVISGVGLMRTKPQWADVDRELYTQNVFLGEEIGINVTSSSNAFHDWKNYEIDEFVYILNGQAIVKSIDGQEYTFNKGDFFIVPKGFTGRWTTQGSKGNFLEIAVYSRKRQRKTDKGNTEPIRISDVLLSGMEYPKDPFVFTGVELMISLEVQIAGTNKKIIENDSDKMNYILNGMVDVTDVKKGKVSYYEGDFYVLPKGFKGEVSYKGFDVFRELVVEKS
ncbi:MAG: cupin domain-containing protein [Bacteroidota bacterium]